jgi:hypothetical protein
MRNTVLGVMAAVTCALLVLAWCTKLDDFPRTDVAPAVRALSFLARLLPFLRSPGPAIFLVDKPIGNPKNRRFPKN